MRTIRRVVTLGIGAAAGATATWLLDPEQGRQRRRDVLRAAAERARQRAAGTTPAASQASAEVVARLGSSARELAARAAAAYREETARHDGALAAGSDR